MNLIFVVPCIMLNSEIIPTRCNYKRNCCILLELFHYEAVNLQNAYVYQHLKEFHKNCNITFLSQ